MHDPDGALVTVVVATYGRPGALTQALASAIDQTMPQWRAIVVGDADPAAATVVAELGDPRVRAVVLPSRQGEQSRPNSVGLALATTPYVALLNHDDLWLPDHLERALMRLAVSGADLYAGSAAFARTRAAVDGVTRPVFTERTPRHRALADAFWAHIFVFEPASAWVMRRSLVERVGPWRPAAELHRTPATDWLLRAWRSGATFAHDPKITVLKVGTHNRKGLGRLYSDGAGDLAVLHGLLRERGARGARALVRDDLRRARVGDGPPRRRARLPFGRGPQARELARRLRDPAAAERFLATGDDVFAEIAAEQHRERGHTLRRLLGERTGEQLRRAEELEPLDALVEHCRAALGTSGA
jgi:glycosyltransferase involved in cell wall biosynthesis